MHVLCQSNNQDLIHIARAGAGCCLSKCHNKYMKLFDQQAAQTLNLFLFIKDNFIFFIKRYFPLYKKLSLVNNIWRLSFDCFYIE